jgi:hypothetical protein
LMKTQRGFACATVVMASFGGPGRATGTSGAAIDEGPPARANPRGDTSREIK